LKDAEQARVLAESQFGRNSPQFTAQDNRYSNVYTHVNGSLSGTIKSNIRTNLDVAQAKIASIEAGLSSTYPDPNAEIALIGEKQYMIKYAEKIDPINGKRLVEEMKDPYMIPFWTRMAQNATIYQNEFAHGRFVNEVTMKLFGILCLELVSVGVMYVFLSRKQTRHIYNCLDNQNSLRGMIASLRQTTSDVMAMVQHNGEFYDTVFKDKLENLLADLKPVSTSTGQPNASKLQSNPDGFFQNLFGFFLNLEKNLTSQQREHDNQELRENQGLLQVKRQDGTIPPINDLMISEVFIDAFNSMAEQDNLASLTVLASTKLTLNPFSVEEEKIRRQVEKVCEVIVTVITKLQNEVILRDRASFKKMIKTLDGIVAKYLNFTEKQRSALSNWATVEGGTTKRNAVFSFVGDVRETLENFFQYLEVQPPMTEDSMKLRLKSKLRADIANYDNRLYDRPLVTASQMEQSDQPAPPEVSDEVATQKVSILLNFMVQQASKLDVNGGSASPRELSKLQQLLASSSRALRCEAVVVNNQEIDVDVRKTLGKFLQSRRFTELYIGSNPPEICSAVAMQIATMRQTLDQTSNVAETIKQIKALEHQFEIDRLSFEQNQ
jgi:tetrahydromethanopterin S-methyltransferase subunit B